MKVVSFRARGFGLTMADVVRGVRKLVVEQISLSTPESNLIGSYYRIHKSTCSEDDLLCCSGEVSSEAQRFPTLPRQDSRMPPVCP